MKRLPEWDAQIKDAFVFGYARTGAINSFDLLDNFAIEGAPALGIDNIPIGQNMEKHTFRMDKGAAEVAARDWPGSARDDHRSGARGLFPCAKSTERSPSRS